MRLRLIADVCGSECVWKQPCGDSERTGSVCVRDPKLECVCLRAPAEAANTGQAGWLHISYSNQRCLLQLWAFIDESSRIDRSIRPWIDGSWAAAAAQHTTAMLLHRYTHTHTH